MCRKIQNNLLEHTPPAPSNVPVYLARYGLKKAVHSFAHEEEFASILEKGGVEIIFPEQLNLAQQIRLVTDRPNIVGLAGSAFHTAAFAPPRKLLILNYSSDPLSSQALIDRVCKHNAIYLYSPDGIQSEKPTEEFITGFSFIDPKRTARELLRIVNPFMRPDYTTVHKEIEAFGVADKSVLGGLSRINIALGRPTRQSSVGPFSKRLRPEQDAAGAVCGFCTGSYQFHTDFEDRPWWDVDLGGLANVQEIRLFNRLDPGRERASNFNLHASDDGISWTETLQHRSDLLFGGLDGYPFIWNLKKALFTRFIRITLLDTTFLHLDQVVIYGLPSTKVERKQSLCRYKLLRSYRDKFLFRSNLEI